MRSLLKSVDIRRIELIELLLAESDWVTIATIAQQLKSSIRIIKDDISYINKTYPYIKIDSSSSGIRLTNNNQGLKYFYRHILKNTLNFQVLETIFFEETYSVEALAEKLFTSTSSIYRSISQINHFFNKNFESYIETNPCRLIGNEKRIRYFYSTYFNETATPFDWDFTQYDRLNIDRIFNKILDTFLKNIDIDFAYYHSIRLVVMVNLIRYQHDHLIETASDESFLFKLIFNIIKHLYPKTFSFQSTPTFSTEFVYQVFSPYVNGGIFYNFDQFNKLRAKNSSTASAIRHLENQLITLAKTHDIPINVEDAVFSVFGTTTILDYDPNGSFILYDRNQQFVNRIKKFFPSFYNSLIEIFTDYLHLLDRDSSSSHLNLLIFTLFTYWEDLSLTLYRTHNNVKILIMSDRHISHAKFISDIITFTLGKETHITLFNTQELSVAKIEGYHSDLIISTFPLPHNFDGKYIVVENYPTTSDLLVIEQRINQIMLEKYI